MFIKKSKYTQSLSKPLCHPGEHLVQNLFPYCHAELVSASHIDPEINSG